MGKNKDQKFIYADVVFQEIGDGDLLFVEVEDLNGESLNVGEWFHSDNGYAALRLRLSAKDVREF